ncbi:MAG: InlB B-repeat-containing protein [Oscillospiraceae bacterium]|nr:InlB B-repeat-containing protein [Oscillospiraceae bacterium]
MNIKFSKKYTVLIIVLAVLLALASPLQSFADDIENTVTYKITYTGSAQVDHVADVEIGEIYALLPSMFSAPAGLSFAGWQINGSGVIHQPGFKILVAGDVVITAAWLPSIYTLTYKANEGVGDDIEVTKEFEEVYLIEDNTFKAQEGYEFIGWNTQADGLGVAYAVDDMIIIVGDIDLYAQWQLKKYEVTFYDYDETTVLKTETVVHGASATAPDEPDNLTGWHFDHWEPEDFSVIKGNLDVIAKYERNVYTVTFVDWDDTVLKEEEVLFGDAATAPIPPARPGYTFIGWDVAFDDVTSDLTVQAQYNKVPDELVGLKIGDAQGVLAPINVALQRGSTMQFTALLDGVIITDDVVWLIANSQLATVTSDGLVIVNKLYTGQVTLMLFNTSNNMSASITIRVI